MLCVQTESEQTRTISPKSLASSFFGFGVWSWGLSGIVWTGQVLKIGCSSFSAEAYETHSLEKALSHPCGGPGRCHTILSAGLNLGIVSNKHHCWVDVSERHLKEFTICKGPEFPKERCEQKIIIFRVGAFTHLPSKIKRSTKNIVGSILSHLVAKPCCQATLTFQGFGSYDWAAQPGNQIWAQGNSDIESQRSGANRQCTRQARLSSAKGVAVCGPHQIINKASMVSCPHLSFCWSRTARWET